jgi:signal peptidase I
MTDTPTGGRPRALGCLFEVVETLVLTVLIFLGIQTFVAQPYQVEQESMENTLQPGQYVLVDKLTARWSQYERGDIVVFHAPEGFRPANDVPFIKRVIGLPGDTVELRAGAVYVNDVELDEGYVFDDGANVGTEPGPEGAATWVVPTGMLFVLGDHRPASEDSRVFGPIEISSVLGRAWLRYWPLDSFGILKPPAYPSGP